MFTNAEIMPNIRLVLYTVFIKFWRTVFNEQIGNEKHELASGIIKLSGRFLCLFFLKIGQKGHKMTIFGIILLKYSITE